MILFQLYFLLRVFADKAVKESDIIYISFNFFLFCVFLLTWWKLLENRYDHDVGFEACSIYPLFSGGC